MVNVVCIKYGRYYGAFYVNRLYVGVKRHLVRPFRFVCVTNDPTGIRPEVECVPFAENPGVPGRKWPNIFSKLTLFKDGFADLEGPTLCLDIDTLVMGPLDKFFDYRPGDFCIIRNWVEFYKHIAYVILLQHASRPPYMASTLGDSPQKFYGTYTRSSPYVQLGFGIPGKFTRSIVRRMNLCG